jgi:hypothetical protein
MRVVLFLACLALASAKLPLHHAAKTHPLTKHAAPKHHPVAKANFSGDNVDNVEAQLAKLQKDISALTNGAKSMEKLVLPGKELEEEKPMFLMMDVGSSGVKVYAYARRSSDCVRAPPPGGGGWTLNSCGHSVKFTPSLYMWDINEIDNFFAGVSHAMDTLKIEGGFARATAGQRIIEEGWNRATWAKFESGVNGLVNAFDWSGSTIPGTDEAKYEYVSNGGNFLSMGGASAQMGFVLESVNLVNGFFDLLENGEIEDMDPCMGQKQGDATGSGGGDFVKVIAHVGRGQFGYRQKAKCLDAIRRDHDQICFGLISWLATGRGDVEDCSTENYYHRAGGNDGMRGTFYADADDAIIEDCFTQGSRDYDNCYGHILEWVSNDPQVHLVAEVVAGVKVTGITGFTSARSIIGRDGGRAKFTRAAGDPTFDPTTRTADASGRSNIGGAFWAMFTTAIEEALGVDVHSYDDDVDWMPAFAATKGLTATCDIFQFAPDANAANCGGNVADLPAVAV